MSIVASTLVSYECKISFYYLKYYAVSSHLLLVATEHN